MEVYGSQEEMGKEVARLRAELRRLKDNPSAGENEVRAILDALPDSVKVFDEERRLIYINPRGLELHQAPDLESMSQPGVDTVAPEYFDKVMDVHRRILAGETVVGTYEIVGLEGRRVHVETCAIPFPTPDGGKGHMCLSRDVTARVAADKALRRSEERLRLVQEATAFADFEAGLEGLSFFAERFAEQVGLPPETAFLSHEERELLREVGKQAVEQPLHVLMAAPPICLSRQLVGVPWYGWAITPLLAWR